MKTFRPALYHDSVGIMYMLEQSFISLHFASKSPPHDSKMGHLEDSRAVVSTKDWTSLTQRV